MIPYIMALFVGGWALRQLWLFWVAPFIGALVAGVAWRVLESEEVVEKRPPVVGEVRA